MRRIRLVFLAFWLYLSIATPLYVQAQHATVIANDEVNSGGCLAPEPGLNPDVDKCRWMSVYYDDGPDPANFSYCLPTVVTIGGWTGLTSGPPECPTGYMGTWETMTRHKNAALHDTMVMLSAPTSRNGWQDWKKTIGSSLPNYPPDNFWSTEEEAEQGFFQQSIWGHSDTDRFDVFASLTLSMLAPSHDIHYNSRVYPPARISIVDHGCNGLGDSGSKLLNGYYFGHALLGAAFNTYSENDSQKKTGTRHIPAKINSWELKGNQICSYSSHPILGYTMQGMPLAETYEPYMYFVIQGERAFGNSIYSRLIQQHQGRLTFPDLLNSLIQSSDPRLREIVSLLRKHFSRKKEIWQGSKFPLSDYRLEISYGYPLCSQIGQGYFGNTFSPFQPDLGGEFICQETPETIPIVVDPLSPKPTITARKVRMGPFGSVSDPIQCPGTECPGPQIDRSSILYKLLLLLSPSIA